MASQELKHATFVFERICAAPNDRVFAAFANPKQRERWGAPSETAAFIHDKADFREGGIDVFRCGDKNDPQYRGVTTYYDIVRNERIISSDVVATQGKKMLVTMVTTTFEHQAAGTKVIVTAQLTSLGGEAMLNGAKFGYNASLDHLVRAMQ